MTRTRLDIALVARGLCASREQAQRAVMAGQVTVNHQPAHKSSQTVADTDELALAAPERFVSRGGHKLEHALLHFRVAVAGQTAVDLGASTGGFTDCLLQHGAARVYAVDVGHGQLAWKLRRDPRVVVMERTNARQLSPRLMPAGFAPVDLVTVDCSFISLRLILPAALSLVRVGGQVLALVKPQFEAGKVEVDRGAGVITDVAIHERVLADLAVFVREQSSGRWLGVTESPLLGPAGNKEFFALLEKVE